MWYSPQQFTFLLIFSRTRRIFSFIFLSMHCPESSKEAAQVSWHNLSDQKSETQMTQVLPRRSCSRLHHTGVTSYFILFCFVPLKMSCPGQVCMHSSHRGNKIQDSETLSRRKSWKKKEEIVERF